MKLPVRIIFIILGILSGMLLYAYYNEWIIIKNPWRTSDENDTYTKATRIPINLFFWRHNQWEKETISCVFSDDIQERGFMVTQSWFYEANQRGFIKNNSAVETVLYDPRYRCLYISLTATPFDLNQSTQEALYILESLLKTMRYALLPDVQLIQFLIHHKLYIHPHIDFTQSLPILGLDIVKQ